MDGQWYGYWQSVAGPPWRGSRADCDHAEGVIPMHYPWWYVPFLTAPMLIAVISVVHVLVSHYAVGGGLFLAVEIGHAYRTHDREYVNYLRRHARFFILVTVVFGAITGVGIWWIIGLSSPLATQLLIHTFVFGWATEYVFFIVEIASAFVFYYYWDRLPQRTHVIIGWIYAAAAWISLVLITGITAFMLNPGVWAWTGSEERDFWTAFLNPQFLPQTIARTGGALLLSSLYVYLHASVTIGDARLRDMIASRSARPALLGAVLITVGGLAWYVFLPESAQAALHTASVLNVLMVLIFALTVIVFFLIYFGPYRNPGWLSPGFAGSLCLFGIAAFSTGEFIREAVRKPFVVYNLVLGNQVLAKDVPAMRKLGCLESGVWTKAFVAHRYPQVMVTDDVDDEGLPVTPYIDDDRLLKLSYWDRIKLGRVLFLHQCNDCHDETLGYSAVGPLLQGWPRERILARVKHLDDIFFMPPWSGTEQEAELITDFLTKISPQRPAGMRIPTEEGSQQPESTDALEMEAP
jgi:cytochrome bd ubiquinol oxidase subunit I